MEKQQALSYYSHGRGTDRSLSDALLTPLSPNTLQWNMIFPEWEKSQSGFNLFMNPHTVNAGP